MTKLDELKALMAKATVRPWAVDPDDRPDMEWNNHIVSISDPDLTICFMSHDDTKDNIEGSANAGLIVNAINALPALIAAVEALKRIHAESPASRTAEIARAALAKLGE